MIKSEVLENIMSKYNLSEGSRLGIELLNQMSTTEKIEMKDLQCMLEIRNSTMSKLRKKTQKHTKIRFNKYEGMKSKRLMQKEKINYKEFQEIKNALNVKDYTLIQMLGISGYCYQKMKKEQAYKVRIKDIRVKHIVELIKIDLKYLKKKSTYCTIDEIKEMCSRREITINEFAKYYDNNPKHARFNQMIVEKSKQGFWNNPNTKISKKFMEIYSAEMVRKLQEVAERVSKITGCRKFNEDLIQDTIVELIQKGGIIVKNFSFDIEIAFDILMYKAKYIMLNIYQKKYKENHISYNGFEDNYVDHMDFLKDERYSPQLLLEE